MRRQVLHAVVSLAKKDTIQDWLVIVTFLKLLGCILKMLITASMLETITTLISYYYS